MWLQVSYDGERIGCGASFGELAMLFVARCDAVPTIIGTLDAYDVTRLRAADRQFFIFAYHSIVKFTFMLFIYLKITSINNDNFSRIFYVESFPSYFRHKRLHRREERPKQREQSTLWSRRPSETEVLSCVSYFHIYTWYCRGFVLFCLFFDFKQEKEKIPIKETSNFI